MEKPQTEIKTGTETNFESSEGISTTEQGEQIFNPEKYEKKTKNIKNFVKNQKKSL